MKIGGISISNNDLIIRIEEDKLSYYMAFNRKSDFLDSLHFHDYYKNEFKARVLK